MTTPILHVGNKNYSSWSLRPWLVYRHFNLPFEERLIPLFDDNWERSIGAVSPSGKVPCLVDGDLVIWETLAIIEYAAERHRNVPIWPGESKARAVARSISCEMHAGFGAMRAAMPMNVRKSLPGRGRTPEALKDIARLTALWRDCRAKYGKDGDFLFGPFSAADAMYAPVASRFTTYAVELDPVSDAYVKAVLALPAMAEWCAAGRAETWIIEHDEVA
jgi:glutathione S-transferase